MGKVQTTRQMSVGDMYEEIGKVRKIEDIRYFENINCNFVFPIEIRLPSISPRDDSLVVRDNCSERKPP